MLLRFQKGQGAKMFSVKGDVTLRHFLRTWLLCINTQTCDKLQTKKIAQKKTRSRSFIKSNTVKLRTKKMEVKFKTRKFFKL